MPGQIDKMSKQTVLVNLLFASSGLVTHPEKLAGLLSFVNTDITGRPPWAAGESPIALQSKANPTMGTGTGCPTLWSVG